MHVTYRIRSLEFLVKFYFKVFKTLHLLSLVNMSNFLFYTIFTHACDLEVTVTDLDMFI